MSDELHRSIGRMEGKIDEVLKNQDSFREKFDKHDQRLRHLENTYFKAMGIFAAIGFGISWVWEFFTSKFYR